MDEEPEPTWMAFLDAVTSCRRLVAEMEYLAVQMLRDEGRPWDEIGARLNLSRQAARRRFERARQRRP